MQFLGETFLTENLAGSMQIFLKNSITLVS